MTIVDFIRINGITMTVKYLGSRVADERWRHDAWRCIIRMAGRRMQVTFTMGLAYEGREPTLDQVLDSLASDAALIENSNWDLWGFVQEVGGDVRDLATRRMFKNTVKQTERLQRFIVDSELYEMLVWQTSRL